MKLTVCLSLRFKITKRGHRSRFHIQTLQIFQILSWWWFSSWLTVWQKSTCCAGNSGQTDIQSCQCALNPLGRTLWAPAQRLGSAEFLSASLWSSSVSEVFSQPESGCSVGSGSFPRLCVIARPVNNNWHAVYLWHFLVHLNEFSCTSFHIPLKLSNQTEPVQRSADLPSNKRSFLLFISEITF